MEMSHARISSAVGVRPTPYLGDCASAATPISNTNARTGPGLSVPIGHAPVARDSPRLNGVVEPRHAERFVVRLVPVFCDLCSRRLHLTDLVGAARLELGFLPVPIPLVAESGMRHAGGRSLDLRSVPSLAAIGGDLHLFDRAAA